MMKRSASIFVSVIALTAGMTLMTSADVQESKKKHEEKFCTVLKQFHSDLSTLLAMGPQSTLQELRNASDRVVKDANQVEKQGSKIKTPTAKEFKGAAQQLRTETRSLPENITIEQAQMRIQEDVQNLRQSARVLAVESNCPIA